MALKGRVVVAVANDAVDDGERNVEADDDDVDDDEDEEEEATLAFVGTS